MFTIVFVVEAKNNSSDTLTDISIANFIISAATLVILSQWMLIFGIKVYVFLSVAQTKLSMDARVYRERQIATLRVLFISVGFSLCYLVRSICSALLAIDAIGSANTTSNFSLLAWYLCSQWIPFVIPVYIIM